MVVLETPLLTCFVATSGACATIASDALMNPFDGMAPSILEFIYTQNSLPWAMRVSNKMEQS